METEKNTPDYPSPHPPPTCCTQTNSCTLHCYNAGPPHCAAVCSVWQGDPLQQKVDASSPLNCIPLISHQTDFQEPGWNLGLGYLISVS